MESNILYNYDSSGKVTGPNFTAFARTSVDGLSFAAKLHELERENEKLRVDLEGYIKREDWGPHTPYEVHHVDGVLCVCGYMGVFSTDTESQADKLASFLTRIVKKITDYDGEFRHREHVEYEKLKSRSKNIYENNDKKSKSSHLSFWLTGETSIAGGAIGDPYTDEPYSVDGKFVNVDIADWAGLPGPASFEFKNESEATDAENTLNGIVKQRNQARRLAVEFRNKIKEMENTMTESKSSENPAIAERDAARNELDKLKLENAALLGELDAVREEEFEDFKLITESRENEAEDANSSAIPNGSAVATEEPGAAEGSKPTDDRYWFEETYYGETMHGPDGVIASTMSHGNDQGFVIAEELQRLYELLLAAEKRAAEAERDEEEARSDFVNTHEAFRQQIFRADAAEAELAALKVKLQSGIAAGAERAVETSPIVDGGRYSIICEKLFGNQARCEKGKLSGDPAVFSSVAYCGLEAERICDRLNRERDGRIAAEAEIEELREEVDYLDGKYGDSISDENASTEDETIARLKSQIDFEKTSLAKAEKKLEVHNKLLAKSQSLCNMLVANLNEADRERLDAIKERDEALENLAKVKKVSDVEAIAFVIAEALDRDAARATVHDNREWAKNMSDWVEGFSSQPSTEDQ